MPRRALEPLGGEGLGAAIILVAACISPGNWFAPASVGELLYRLIWVVLYLGATAALMRRFGTAWLVWTLRSQPLLCILLVLAVVSCLWSLAPLVSLRKALSLVGTTVLGLFIGYACSTRQLMQALLWTFTLVIISSLLAVMILPAADTLIGWRGIMTQKNSLGAAAGLAAIFFLVVTQWGGLRPALGAALGALSLLALAQSRSRTSYVAVAVCLFAFAYLSTAPKGRPTLRMLRRLSLALVLGVSLLPFVIGPLAVALSHDDLFNRRVLLWAGVATIVSERPLTGYGYETVWGRAAATLLPHIPATAYRWAASAHNSILHVAGELGTPAAVFACLYLFAALSAAARLVVLVPSAFSISALLFLVGLTVLGFAEAHLLRIHSVFWILFVALTVAAGRELQRLDAAAAESRA